MTDIAIRCEGLAKQYRIGERERYTALRDVISEAATAPFRRVRKSFSNGSRTVRQPTDSSILNPQFLIRNPKSAIGNGTIWALDDVSFAVRRGEVIGIIGRNGAGKSTLLKILSRITKPTRGQAEIHGRVGSLLEVGTGFHPELTGRENIFLNGAILGMRKTEIERKFDEIVAFAEVENFIDTPVKRYSSGMYLRLAFAVAAHMEPDILVVDEVLAVGDAQFQKRCIGKIDDVAKLGRTILFVSHNMAAIQSLCSKTLLVECGRLLGFGDTSAMIAEYENSFLQAKGITAGRGTVHEEEIDLSKEFQVFKIAMLDEFGLVKSNLATWDYVKFRLHYHAKQTVKNGSAVFRVTTREGVPLLLCSSQPDSNVPMEIIRGINHVDCEFPTWPLAAGTYLISAALAVPLKEWLTNLEQAAVLEVEAKDVFESGTIVPNASRALLATPHTWNASSQGK